jgi:hypothetical protein
MAGGDRSDTEGWEFLIKDLGKGILSSWRLKAHDIAISAVQPKKPGRDNELSILGASPHFDTLNSPTYAVPSFRCPV